MRQNRHILDDVDALYRAGAERVAELAREAITARGAFHVALAGGTTPRRLYQMLADTFSERLDWTRVHIWFGDERCVPPTDPESNFRMVRETLLDHVPIPSEQIHRMQGELPPQEAATAYSERLLAGIPREEGLPRLDLVLLGIGRDGHVASLFPENDILAQQAPAAALFVEKLDGWRISLTLPIINNARHVMLFAGGSKKADIIRHIHHPEPDAAPLPVQLLAPVGDLEWFLDAAAARHLRPSEG